MTTPSTDSIPSSDSENKTREARNLYKKSWAETHIESVKISKKKYRDTHREEMKVYRSATKEAAKKRVERYWENNPDKKKTYWKEYGKKNRARIRDRNLKKYYGIGQKEWDVLFDFQGRKCAVCGTTSPGGSRGWCTDHNHSTGVIRGILCRVCNVMLGHAGDSVETLEKAIEYLKHPPYLPG